MIINNYFTNFNFLESAIVNGNYIDFYERPFMASSTFVGDNVKNEKFQQFPQTKLKPRLILPMI